MPLFKNTEPNSGTFEKTIVSLGQNVVNTNWIAINRTVTTDEEGNLFSSFNLPLTTAQKNKYSATLSNGGYLDTAFSGFNQDVIYVTEIPINEYGELIDGKSIKIDIMFSGESTPVEIYSTFIKQNNYTTTFDTYYVDKSIIASEYGQPLNNTNDYHSNVAFLFSDNLKKPKGDATLSWATGYNDSKPFANGKEPFIFSSPGSLNTVDEPVGIAYLDKGFMVFTHPASIPTGGTVTFDTINTEYIQHVVCFAKPNEFYTTNNPTFLERYGTAGYGNQPIFVTEVGLYNSDNELIAIAKPDRPIEKTKNGLIVFDIQIKI